MKRDFKIGIFLTLGILINICLFYLLNSYQNQYIAKEYYAESEHIVASIRKEAALNFAALKQVEPFYTEFGEISPVTFSNIAGSAIASRNTIQAIEWIPSVRLRERDLYESDQRLIYPNFEIKERDAVGQLNRSLKKERYFPVGLVEPIKGNEAAIGFDLSSSAARMKTLTSSASSGEMLATSGIDLVQLDSKDKGFLVFVPVYKEGIVVNDLDSVKGFVLGVYQSTNFLLEAISANIKGNSQVKIIDVTEKDSPQLLTEFLPSNFVSSDLAIQIPIGDIAGRIWMLEAQASQQYLQEKSSYVPISAFVFGMFILAIFLRSYKQTLNYTRVIEKEVNSRTQELKSSHQFVEKLTNSVPILLAYIDHSEVYRFINEKFERQYLKSAHEFKGHSVKEVVGQDDYAKIKPYIELALSGESITFIDEVVLATEKSFLNTTYTPDLNEAGEVQGFFVSIEDVSEQAQDKEQLEKYAQELEFNSWALEEAKESAEAATKLKSIFLANMSHEIRTPLSGVLGLLRLISETKLDSAQTEFLDLAKGSAETLLTIINDILDLSKVEAGKLEIEDHSFCLFDMLHNVEGTYCLLANEQGLEFQLESNIEPNQVIVGDQVRLRQIINNLISNSIKFTSEGKVSLNIALEATTKANAKLTIEVSDTGIGIEADKLDRLFSAFEQADHSTSRKYGGTGLGLTISKKLALLMNGDLFVKSEINKGSTFTCVVEVGTNAEVIKPKSSLLNASSMQFKELTALIVEDNHVNQIIAKKMLTSLEINVTLAENGKEALDKLQASPGLFDVVFMDCMMPVLDGYEATKQIRKTASIAQIPVIAMTANAMQGDREKCLGAGMDDYLTKPIQKNELLKCLALVCEKS